MTPTTQALLLSSLAVAVLGLAAALGSSGGTHPHIVTGGAVEVGSVIPDGTPTPERAPRLPDGTREQARDTR